ncbi:MAG: UDP-N-acetylglucosamine--N-acetylmuramyl-(pentapeptide) pyrophosphoryl-undecaprenol N-acetylglucosamine transferase [Fibrobacter sp.]|nr:UDP-N-acetylglucosamine--N-acetylmuramyl-(pentapeptide) pyrophosphoryl-undecaprenol N-acetylglucosamine transferase [Fibrobacter sp.]
MHILYFITAHGYGHAVRATAIANRIPPAVKITFKTNIPGSFFKEELQRPFCCEPGEFDCGCIQSSGVTVDMEQTLKTYTSLEERNSKIIERELLWCRRNNVDCILSDITPFAFEIAYRLGIVSIAISNFTWFDIYNEYTSFFPEFKPVLDNIQTQYSYADMLLALHPPLQMDYFSRKQSVPVVGRKGKNVRELVIRKYRLSENKKLGLIYVGDFGMDGAQWQRLAEIEDWEFLGLHPLVGNPPNYHIINKKEFRYQDLTASCDVVISKLGYGVVSECFLNGIPLIYLPRALFAEYPALEKAVQFWGGGVCLDEESFLKLDWKEALERAASQEKPPPIESDGAGICAQKIVELLK